MEPSTSGPAERSLQPLFDPASVAVIGASRKEHTWGFRLSTSVLGGAARRAVYLVGRTGGTVLGAPVHPSVLELPEVPELAVVAVPAPAFEGVVDDCLRIGVRALVGITAGLGEKGGEHAAAERALADRIRSAGALLVGPNSAGLADSSTDLRVEFSRRPVGTIGLVTQSGNLIQELARLFGSVGLGFSSYVSVGNQSDLVASDYVRRLAVDDATTAIACYVEDFKDGRRFMQAVGEALSRGKPVVVLSVGRTAAGSRSALSHTGALVTDHRVVAAACRDAGAVLVRTPAEVVDVLLASVAPHRSSGKRVAIVGDGGGHCGIAADVVSSRGLDVPPLSAELSGRLASLLPPAASTSNPVDLAGAAETDLAVFDAVLSTLLGASEIDSVLLTGYFGGYGAFGAERQRDELAAARAIGERAGRSGRPLVVHSMYADSEAAALLRAAGVPVFPRVESAALALESLRRPRAASSAATASPAPSATRNAGPARTLSYFEARALVADAGVPLAPAVQVGSEAEAILAASAVGYPVVVKSLRHSHKSAGGGVVTGIADETELRRVLQVLGDGAPLSPCSVEKMVSGVAGVELIVGARWDANFGVIAVVGFGGVFTEAVDDIAVILSPASNGQIEAEVRELRIGRQLRGGRGERPLDLGALTEVVQGLSVALAGRSEILEIEVNPLLLLPVGAVGLDARVVVAGGVDGAALAAAD